MVGKRRFVLVACSVLATTSLASVSLALDGYSPEPGPSRWGAGDEAGNTNTQTPEKVLEAAKLIRKGKKYLLGHVYEPTMPLFPGNSWILEMKPPTPVGRQVGNIEFFHGEVGQGGTQLDALGHFGLLPPNEPNLNETLYYNRFKGSDVHGITGLQHLGVEKLRPFFTRGILLDVARYQNGNRTLQPGTEISVEMLKATLASQRMTENDIREGDVVLVRTGWEENWDDGTLVYYAGAPGVPGSTPGLGLPAAQWLAAKGVACVGSDNWGVELAGVTRVPGDPSYVEGVSFPVHNELIVRNGIPLQESMHLSELAADAAAELASGRPGKDAYTFAYLFVPVPVEGASGSPGTPLAIK